MSDSTNALIIVTKKKFNPEKIQYLKANFSAHYFKSEYAFISHSGWSIPNKFESFVRYYLEKDGFDFRFQPAQVDYFDKDAKGRKCCRLQQAKDYIYKDYLNKSDFLDDLIVSFQDIYGVRITRDDLNRGDELLEVTTNCKDARMINSIKVLVEFNEKTNEKNNECSSIQDQISNISEEDGIIVEGHRIEEALDEAEKLLEDPIGGIFQSGNRLVRIIECGQSKDKSLKKYMPAHTVIIEDVDVFYLIEILTKLGDWKRYDGRSKTYNQIGCPEKIAKHLLSRKKWNKIPHLMGIIQTPTLRKDGSLVQKPGFDEKSGLFLALGDKFPKVKDEPSEDDVNKAFNILIELLKGFPFDDETSYGKNFSVALSAIFTAVVRKAIPSAPIFGFNAPKMGSGKSLLADVVCLTATGNENFVLPPEKNETEEKKRLFSVLKRGNSIICYDNLVDPLCSPSICCALTQQSLHDRVLGQSESATVSTESTFLATGNNLSFGGDLSTRALLCSLDANEERPEEREFDVNLKKYIPEHRGEIVHAVLTILRNFIVIGKPMEGVKEFGRFEDWSDLVRGAVINLNCADPCDSRKEIECDDPERDLLGGILRDWHECCGEKKMQLRNVVREAENLGFENLIDSFLEISDGFNGKVNMRSLGKQLKKYNKRIEGGFQLIKLSKHQGTDTWMVKKKN